MMSALLSFLGGSAFRAIWGEISAYLTRRQEHAQEIERLRLQGEMDAAQHSRNLEAIRVQAELGVKTIQVQAESDLDRLAMTGWNAVVESTTRLTGLKFIDYWNQSIRPLLATLAIGIVVAEVVTHGFTLTEWNRELVGAILGIFVADRNLAKRGK